MSHNSSTSSPSVQPVAPSSDSMPAASMPPLSPGAFSTSSFSTIPSAFSSPARHRDGVSSSNSSVASGITSAAYAAASVGGTTARTSSNLSTVHAYSQQQPRQQQATSASSAPTNNSSYSTNYTTPVPSRASHQPRALTTPVHSNGTIPSNARFRAGTLDTSLSSNAYTSSRTHAASPMRSGAASGASNNGVKGAGGLYISPSLTPAPTPEDESVLLHVQYGTRVVFRGTKGVTLSARPVTDSTNTSSNGTPSIPGGGPTTPGGGITSASSSSSSRSSSNAAVSFRACTDGRGLGEARETLLLVNCLRRDDRGPIAYGATVAVRCGWAKERFLGIHSTTGEVGFWRTLIGAAEKWVLLRPNEIKSLRSDVVGRAGNSSSTPSTRGHAHALPLSGMGPGGRTGDAGGWVLAGDAIVLQAASTREVVMAREAPEDGMEVMLCPPESALLSNASWSVGWTGTPLYPAWNMTRPYLTGDFVTHPHRHHLSTAQENLFSILPHAANRDEGRLAPRPLSEFSSGEQEDLLVEDLLWVVSGYEGKYIKAFLPSSLSSPPSSSSSLDAAEGVRFKLTEGGREGVEGSLVGMVEKFLPLGGHCLRLRRFVDKKRRYDYGMVAQALAAGLHDLLLKSYALLLAQLEHKHRGAGREGGRGLTLQQLWFHLQPALRGLEGLGALCARVRNKKGGQLLNELRAAVAGSGDEKSAQTHSFLLEKAAGPYMVMLEGWIYRGVLEDPYCEFMIREEQGLEKENVQEDFNAAYWDARSTIRPEHVFGELEEFRPKILTTGKYLNVIRECGLDPGVAELGEGRDGALSVRETGRGGERMPKLRFSAGKAAVGEAIDVAYRRACRLLLDVVLRQHRLLPRLASIKHYFLLDKGDFFVHFMNTAEKELLKSVTDVSPSRLEGLLHLSIQMSVASNDPYKDDVSSSFSNKTLIEHLNAIHKSDRFGGAAGGGGGGGEGLNVHISPATAAAAAASNSIHIPSLQEADLPELPNLLLQLDLSPSSFDISSNTSSLYPSSSSTTTTSGIKAYEAFMLETQVKWPLSLVVSRRAVTKYQLLFRHLFLAKFVERRLHTSWAEQQSYKELDVRQALGLAFCVRHKMQHFLATYIYYMMFEVVEPHWHVLAACLRTGEGVEHLDDVIRLHQEFQDSCLKECLLTDQSILKVLNKILVVCLLFAAYMEQTTRDMAEVAASVSEASGSYSTNLEVDVDGSGVISFISATNGRVGNRGGGGRKTPQHIDNGAVRRGRVARQTAEVRARAVASGFGPTMDAFAKNLDFHTEEFMRRLWEDSRAQYQSSHLSNLLARLDYNGFFAAQFARPTLSSSPGRQQQQQQQQPVS
ncbi:gamma-tubulin complex component 2 [Nannochloropsis oceanica]